MADATQTRPSRAEETRRARRMKPGDVTVTGIKLYVDPSKLDNDTYVHRWVADTGNRVEIMKRQDWDPVDEPVKPDSIGIGTIPTVHGGIAESGKPHGMILMKKYRDWYDEDQKRKRKPLDEIDDAIRGGTAHQKSGESDLNGVTYTPGTNTLTR